MTPSEMSSDSLLRKKKGLVNDGRVEARVTHADLMMGMMALMYCTNEKVPLSLGLWPSPFHFPWMVWSPSY